MNDSDFRWLLPLLLAAVAGMLVWIFVLDGKMPGTDEPPPAPPAEPAPPPRLGPLHPMQPTEPEGDAQELVELPSLDDSDAYFKLALVDVFGPGVDALLVEQALIEKFVTTIDNLPRKHVSEKVRPIGRLADSFQALPRGDEETFELGDDNYDRYNGIVRTFVAVGEDDLVDVYRRFYPLFQEAYVSLGYPSGYFNDRLVEVIDHLVAAPQPQAPIVLERKNVLYTFSDPDLEALSAGEKLMIRIGPANAEVVKARLRSLRTKIAQTPAH